MTPSQPPSARSAYDYAMPNTRAGNKPLPTRAQMRAAGTPRALQAVTQAARELRAAERASQRIRQDMDALLLALWRDGPLNASGRTFSTNVLARASGITWYAMHSRLHRIQRDAELESAAESE